MPSRIKSNPHLSIVIPVFNESRKIARDIRAVDQFLVDNRLSGEILVVDDGSRDRTSEAAGRIATGRNTECRILRYETHRGKGYAVRFGMTRTRGRIILFMDSGSCTPCRDILLGIRLIEDGCCEIAHASRKLHDSSILRPQRLSRCISSCLFRTMVRNLFPIPRTLTDTQMGLKVYRGGIGRELYVQCRSNGFLFDIEIILRAVRAGYRICEFPITWSSDPDTRLSLFRTLLPLLREMASLRTNRIV